VEAVGVELRGETESPRLSKDKDSEYGNARIRRRGDAGVGHRVGLQQFWHLSRPGQAIAVVREALDVGINFLDIAGQHGSGLEESLVDEALGQRRKEVIIATKFGQAEMLGLKDGDLVFSEDKTRQGGSRRWIMRAVEESLTRLKTDYIDLYQVHVADPETPRE
jgi:aryl-alcohol dehydrogenase-like predicted oxidoreductase